MREYRKNPVIVEAFKFYIGMPMKDLERYMAGKAEFHTAEDGNRCCIMLTIRTLEGNMSVSDGDMVIKGVQGEYYPCKPEIFRQTYEAV
jgi:hypothetical protein